VMWGHDSYSIMVQILTLSTNQTLHVAIYVDEV